MFGAYERYDIVSYNGRPGEEVYSNIEGETMGELLGEEYVTEGGYYTGFSNLNNESKFEGSSEVSGKVSSGARVVMASGPLVMDADKVIAEAAT